MKRLGLFIALSVASACTDATDLNSPCTLVKRNPDGGVALPLLKDDPVVKNSANNDFISFGSTECEDQVCVRDSQFNGSDLDGGDTGMFAKGYCSRACVAGSTVGCPSYSGQLDQNNSTKLVCRGLILDEATLQAVKAADPVRYMETFGMTTSPYFCARGGILPDGGIR